MCYPPSQGYKSKNAYILTQMPLPHTVIDLWRMIHEHKCGSIVMVNPWNDDDTVCGERLQLNLVFILTLWICNLVLKVKYPYYIFRRKIINSPK